MMVHELVEPTRTVTEFVAEYPNVFVVVSAYVVVEEGVTDMVYGVSTLYCVALPLNEIAEHAPVASKARVLESPDVIVWSEG